MWSYISRSFNPSDNQRENASGDSTHAASGDAQSTSASSSSRLPPASSSPSGVIAAVQETDHSSTQPIAGQRAFASRRLRKEQRDIVEKPLPNVSLVSGPDSTPADESSECFAEEWLVEIRGAEGTLYEGESYILRFRFTERYPMESPEVTFERASPVHPHVYSNGHICLSILYDGWSPALGVGAICLSLISMLSSCNAKARPIDDRLYVTTSGRRVSPKSMRWAFHDDSV